MDEKKRLYVPVNIKKRKEVLNIDGIGLPEAIKVLTAIVFGLLIGIVLFFLKDKNPFYIFAPTFIIGSGAYIFLKKDRTNRNTVDKVMKFIEFSKAQKLYKYVYFNIYECGRKKNIEKQ